MIDALNAAKEAFAAVPGVATCDIGIAAAISPADYPLIRIVPRRAVPGAAYGGRTIEAWVYFGTPTTEAGEGLPAVYAALATMEADILEVLHSLGGRYIETITDEDRLKPYKIMAINCELPEPPRASVRCVMTTVLATVALDAGETVLAPFASTLQATTADDWTAVPAAGTIERKLNGAASTRTRVTVSGEVQGPDGAELAIGIYAAGVLVGNRLLVALTGLGDAIAFELGATYYATADAVLDVRAEATGDADYAFADLRLEAQGA